MNPALQLFLTVTLPIMITIVVGMWTTNRRLTEIIEGITESRNGILRRHGQHLRLDRIERKLDTHEERIVRLEQRTSPIHR